MYQVGDHIVYGGEGVCRVEAVGGAPIPVRDCSKLYYTLRPIYHDGVIYAPVDVDVLMRPVLKREEALSLISGISSLRTKEDVAAPQDAKQAAAEYRAMLETYDTSNLLKLIRRIYLKNQKAAAEGKNLGQTEDRFMKRAKELLHGELAVALEIPVEQVEGVIQKAADI